MPPLFHFPSAIFHSVPASGLWPSGSPIPSEVLPCESSIFHCDGFWPLPSAIGCLLSAMVLGHFILHPFAIILESLLQFLNRCLSTPLKPFATFCKYFSPRRLPVDFASLEAYSMHIPCVHEPLHAPGRRCHAKTSRRVPGLLQPSNLIP